MIAFMKYSRIKKGSKMNCIQKIMMSFVLFLGSEQIILSSVKGQVTTKAQQVKEKVQAAKAAAPAAKVAAPAVAISKAQEKPTEKAAPAKAPSEKAPSRPVPSDLIKSFTDAVGEIKEKPTAPKSDVKDEKTSKEEQKSYEEKKKSYYDKVEKAYDSYKKLYEELKKAETTVTTEEAGDIKKAAIKLFNSRNIQNMALPSKVSHPEKTTGSATPPAAPAVPAAKVA